MNFITQRNNLFAELKFLLLNLCCWWGAVMIGGCLNLHINTQSPIFISFISLAIAGTMLFLSSSGYFQVLSLFPRKSDIILATISVTLGGLLASFITFPLQRGSFTDLICLSLLSGTSASLVFCLEELLKTCAKKYQQQIRIVLDLEARERAPVIEELAAHELLSQIQIMSRQDLETELASGSPVSIDLIIISQSADTAFEKEDSLLKAYLAGIPIIDYRTLCSSLSGRIRLGHLSIWQYILTGSHKTELAKAYSRIKNCAEPFLALTLLILLSPLMLILALAIKLNSPGPCLFSQNRVGFRQKSFQLYKFRIMNFEANPQSHRTCLPDSLNLTSVGQFLRKYKLDRLPQLWNVLKGEMSFIGPQPEHPLLLVRLEELIPAFTLRTLIKPGITGWAQINSGYSPSFSGSGLKLEYDLYYLQNISFRLDLIILIKTIMTAIFGRQEHDITVIVELNNEDTRKSAEFLNNLGSIFRP